MRQTVCDSCKEVIGRGMLGIEGKMQGIVERVGGGAYSSRLTLVDFDWCIRCTDIAKKALTEALSA